MNDNDLNAWQADIVRRFALRNGVLTRGDLETWRAEQIELLTQHLPITAALEIEIGEVPGLVGLDIRLKTRWGIVLPIFALGALFGAACGVMI